MSYGHVTIQQSLNFVTCYLQERTPEVSFFFGKRWPPSRDFWWGTIFNNLDHSPCGGNALLQRFPAPGEGSVRWMLSWSCRQLDRRLPDSLRITTSLQGSRMMVSFWPFFTWFQVIISHEIPEGVFSGRWAKINTKWAPHIIHWWFKSKSWVERRYSIAYGIISSYYISISIINFNLTLFEGCPKYQFCGLWSFGSVWCLVTRLLKR